MNEEKLFNLLDRLLKQYKDDVIVLNSELKNTIFPDNCFNDDLIRSREELDKTLYDGLRSNFINEVMGKLDGLDDLSGHPIEDEINEIDLEIDLDEV